MLFGWIEYLHRKASTKIAKMQENYGVLAGCKLTSKHWMKQLVVHLILISHLQLLFWNFSLHHKTKGYLCAKAVADIKQEVSAFLNTRPTVISPSCQYFLEIEHKTRIQICTTYKLICTNSYKIRIHITKFVYVNLFFSTNSYVQICIIQLCVYKFVLI